MLLACGIQCNQIAPHVLKSSVPRLFPKNKGLTAEVCVSPVFPLPPSVYCTRAKINIKLLLNTKLRLHILNKEEN